MELSHTGSKEKQKEKYLTAEEEEWLDTQLQIVRGRECPLCGFRQWAPTLRRGYILERICRSCGNIVHLSLVYAENIRLGRR